MDEPGTSKNRQARRGAAARDAEAAQQLQFIAEKLSIGVFLFRVQGSPLVAKGVGAGPRAARLIDWLSTRPAEATAAASLEAVWPRQHWAVIPRAFIPALFLARRMPREAPLDRRLDPSAARAIWVVGHIGLTPGAAPGGLLRLPPHKSSMCLCRIFHRDDIAASCERRLGGLFRFQHPAGPRVASSGRLAQIDRVHLNAAKIYQS